MVHREYTEMLSAHALAALDAEELSSLEAHLESCAECSSLLVEWSDTASLLAFAAPPAEPSPELRDRILSIIRSDNKTSEGGGRSGGAKVIPLPIKTKTAWSSLQQWGAIAAVFFFAVFVISLTALWNQNNAARQELAYLSLQVKHAQQQLARQRDAIEIVTKPGTRTAELSGTDLAPEAHATVAYDLKGRAVLLADGLPRAEEGKTYQLWFIVGGHPLPGNVFTLDENGSGALEDQIPENARDSAVFAITLEPEGGAQLPTGPIYLTSGR